jgi:hypothetical protein
LQAIVVKYEHLWCKVKLITLTYGEQLPNQLHTLLNRVILDFVN